MLTVWGRTNSSNVMKVLWLLDELGLPYQRIDAGRGFGRTDTADYRSKSPLGLVPMLEDGDFAMFESNAILRYLCRAHAPATPLFPADPQAAGAIDAWLDLQQCALAPPAGRVFRAAALTPTPQRDPAAIAAALADLAPIWQLIDSRLATREYICGGGLTLADIAFGPHAHRWFVMQIERPPAEHLRAWYERLLQRPPYACHCAQAPS